VYVGGTLVDVRHTDTDMALAAHIADAQATFATPPSYNLNDLTAQATNPDFFGMGVYSDPFAVNDMPMDLGSYTDTFNWVCIDVTDWHEPG
jgi:hypothetical protein